MRERSQQAESWTIPQRVLTCVITSLLDPSLFISAFFAVPLDGVDRRLV